MIFKKRMTDVVNKRIANTNLYVFSRDSANDLFTYSRPITADEGKDVAGKVTINGGLGVTDEGVLYNISTLKGIVANRNLMKQTDGRVWFPTIQEGLLLHDAGLLPEGEFMDFGIAVFDGGNPDKEIARSIMQTATDKGYSLPVLASFKSLDLNESGKRYGFMPTIVSSDGLIMGQDETNVLSKFHAGNSGVRRVFRCRVGGWNAYWNVNLGNFCAGCRVGRVSVVGSKKNLRDLVSSQIEQNYNPKRRDLQEKLASLDAQEKKCVDSAEEVLGR